MSTSADKSRPATNWSRRSFLKAGAFGAAGLTLADGAAASVLNKDVNLIVLFLVGGPSQLETFDLKPNAPDHVRGPFRPIRTSVPGIDISEHLPRTAALAQHFSIVRSVYHTAAPIHETGQQLLQTGALFTDGRESPHYGAALSYAHGPRDADVPPFVVLPGPIQYTGVCVSHGQTAGPLGNRFGPMCYRLPGIDPQPRRHAAADSCVDETVTRGDFESRTFESFTSAATRRAFALQRESVATRERFGAHSFGQSVLLARRLVEHGVRCVTVNMFDTVFNRTTWDCHADGGSLASTLSDYATTLCPMFDQAYSALLGDLHQRGMLANTLVLAAGEFGRTPVINPRGGRDHWTGAWPVLFAGGGIRGGQVVGATDAWAGEVADRPVQLASIAATVYRLLGIDPTRIPGPDGKSIPCLTADVISELI